MTGSEFELEEVFDHIGHFGIYQLGLFVFAGLIAVEGALQPISTTFLHVSMLQPLAITSYIVFLFEMSRTY